jgi:hypothetical protein
MLHDRAEKLLQDAEAPAKVSCKDAMLPVL